MEDLRSWVLCFREAIESCHTLIQFSEMKSDFPENACADVSLLLAEWLRGKGFDRIQYITGVDSNGNGHAWLRVSGIVIDITVDQFDRNLSLVDSLYMYQGEDQGVQCRFMEERRVHNNPSLNKWGSDMEEQYAAVYNIILQHMS